MQWLGTSGCGENSRLAADIGKTEGQVQFDFANGLGIRSHRAPRRAAAARLSAPQRGQISYRGASGPQIPREGRFRGVYRALRPFQPK